MDRLSRIQNIIRWQELYRQKKSLVAVYESSEIRLAKLKEDHDSAIREQSKLSELQETLSQKVIQEEERLDHILNQIEEMEKDRDNLKMSRQIKSWEKDMDRYVQDRSVVEAQFYYDKSKVGDIVQELETLQNNINRYMEEIETLETDINAIKAETKDEREAVESEMEGISSQFDAQFVQYLDRLLERNKGIVMAEIEEDSCSGCNILLPTSYHGGDLNDVDDLDLLQCPNCIQQCDETIFLLSGFL